MSVKLLNTSDEMVLIILEARECERSDNRLGSVLLKNVMSQKEKPQS